MITPNFTQAEIEPHFNRIQTLLRARGSHYSPIIVQVQRSDTTVHRDLFAILAVHDRHLITGGLLTAHAVSDTNGEIGNDYTIRLGELCQYISLDLAPAPIKSPTPHKTLPQRKKRRPLV